MARLPNETLEQYIVRLEAENSTLNAGKTTKRTAGRVECRVTDKGGLSIYIGQGKWPWSPYINQFMTLAESFDEVLNFVGDNFDKFSIKDGVDKDALRHRFVMLKAKSEAVGSVFDDHSVEVDELKQQLADAHAMLEELTKSSAGDNNSEGDGEGENLSE